MLASFHLRLTLLSLLGLAGCVDHFSTPSAYSTQSYLCDSAHAAEYAVTVQSCQDKPGCAGVLSMKGTMQSEPFTVQSVLTDAAYSIVQAPGTSTKLLDEARMTGSSPYFVFVFHLKSVGGSLDAPIDTTRTLTINGGAPALAGSLSDDQVDVGDLLEVGNQSAEQHALDGSGTVVITHQSIDALRGTFAGTFGGVGNDVQGCFDMFPLENTVNPAPSR